ncbi:aldose epimerase family protein [Consotaella salsifontis]|uniref:Aldose 1-epimerase n=1 Tax=Consotaella salsifontis TaxID=1365950 RepID=A0A1T4TFI4_9HYPH|nr:aldose epimerase family protein [Consotaella salsifontis]SKA39216.1 aldose 1-epimerase [Consotaella salsifontis]
MHYKVERVGEVDGHPVDAITLGNEAGSSVTVLSYGCIVQSLRMPDRNGTMADITLGYEKFERYLEGHPFFGAIAGRVANRIDHGRFTLNGKSHRLECNEPTGHHLHGGSQGFNKAVWGYSIERRGDAVLLHLHHTSPDGDSGYPGRLDATHTVALTEDNALWLNFRAVSDADTIVNLVNHNYYNLSGVEGATIEDHELTLAADYVLPVDERILPTGEVLSVAGTPFDFTRPRKVGEAMAGRPDRDFDHAFALRSGGGLKPCAELYHPASGRLMTVETTQPSVQFYNGVKLSKREWFGRTGVHYPAFAGLCLETQHFPDSINRPQFPTIVLKAGALYEHKTVHRFSIR